MENNRPRGMPISTDMSLTALYARLFHTIHTVAYLPI